MAKKVNEIDKFKKGQIVSLGKITKIYTRSSKFVIYETNDSGNVAYYLNDDTKTEHISELKPLIIEIDSLTQTIREKKKYAQRKSAALVECFYDRPEAAKKVLKSLIVGIKEDRTLKSRLIYVVSALIFVILNLFIALIINTSLKSKLHEQFILFFTIATFGSLGGLISILIKNVKLNLDIQGNKTIQIIDSCSRIFLSMISSIIIYVFIKSNIILGIVNDLNNIYVIYSFAIIAGFSETFIPELINKTEESNLK